MSMSTIQKETTDAPPYTDGDPIAVERNGQWAEATVHDHGACQHPVRFGLRWMILVQFVDSLLFERVFVDDNGRNHTWRQQVCPSNRLGE